MARYLVFDIETTIKETYKRKANCFDPENWIVARGWKFQGDKQNSWNYYRAPSTDYLCIPDDVNYIIGQNIKFDLLWELSRTNPDLHKFFQRGGKIWCCQYAEYLLEGHIQEAHMVSMDKIIEKYGGRKKLDEVKLFWEHGINTDQIPEDLLVDYLVGTEGEHRNSGDVGNTELIFLGQLKRAREAGMVPIIQDRMDGLLCTTFMEWAGLKIDVKEAARRLGILKNELAAADAELSEYTVNLPFEFNWNSGVHKSAIIFGGTVKYEVREPYKDENGEWVRKQEKQTHYLLSNGKTTHIHPDQFLERPDVLRHFVRYSSGAKKGSFKTRQVTVPGELKIKWQDRFHELPGYMQPRSDWEGKQTDGAGRPIYGTGKEVMEVILINDEIHFLAALKKKVALDKEIGTYYVKIDDKGNKSGMLTCVQTTDHVIHHKLNHVNTVTSRLSSADPNLQNLPRGDKSEAKAMFVSRFGSDGVMVEADYSQLEVVVQGVLSGDTQLCIDLNSKIDFHCKRVSAQFKITYEQACEYCKDENYPEYSIWKPRRTKAKNFSFQRAYGAGAQAISDSTKIPKEEVEQLIEIEERMYPGVVLFNAAVESAVTKSAVPFQAPAEDGSGAWKTYRMGEWRAPTGTRYRWRSHDAPVFLARRGIKDTFSPPELKNYPVQGTGGEMVQTILGLLWRHFVATDGYGGKACLVNTVHDCIWVDCHKDVLQEVCRDVQRIMQSIPEYYNKRYGMNITVPFPVEVECGPNMNNLKHWHDGEPAWHHKLAA